MFYRVSLFVFLLSSFCFAASTSPTPIDLLTENDPFDLSSRLHLLDEGDVFEMPKKIRALILPGFFETRYMKARRGMQRVESWYLLSLKKAFCELGIPFQVLPFNMRFFLRRPVEFVLRGVDREFDGLTLVFGHSYGGIKALEVAQFLGADLLVGLASPFQGASPTPVVRDLANCSSRRGLGYLPSFIKSFLSYREINRLIPRGVFEDLLKYSWGRGKVLSDFPAEKTLSVVASLRRNSCLGRPDRRAPLSVQRALVNLAFLASRHPFCVAAYFDSDSEASRPQNDGLLTERQQKRIGSEYIKVTSDHWTLGSGILEKGIDWKKIVKLSVSKAQGKL